MFVVVRARLTVQMERGIVGGTFAGFALRDGDLVGGRGLAWSRVLSLSSHGLQLCLNERRLELELGIMTGHRLGVWR